MAVDWEESLLSPIVRLGGDSALYVENVIMFLSDSFAPAAT